MRAAADSDHQECPDIATEIGEDPARFLDHALFDGDTDAKLRAQARIRGIDHVHVVEGWIEAETQLDRGPRQEVIKRLNQRKAHLEANGERPDELNVDRDAVEPTESVVTWADREDGEHRELTVRNSGVSA
ncbi:hypothetical protein [Halostella litorea]|uniref:hypothetical protein n=1 Tax=Halostella litorea TaxID=2528831 RepID=UPI001091E45B|nr:hypothetical protein [Halostella litorea]